MTYQMNPETPAGVRFADAALKLIPQLRERAGPADLEGALCVQNFEDLAASGISAAFVPTELGGFGLDSVHEARGLSAKSPSASRPRASG